MKIKIIAFDRYELLNPFEQDVVNEEYDGNNLTHWLNPEWVEWNGKHPESTRQGELVGNEVLKLEEPIKSELFEGIKNNPMFQVLKYPLNSTQEIELLQEVEPKLKTQKIKTNDGTNPDWVDETDEQQYQTDLKHFKNRTGRVK